MGQLSLSFSTCTENGVEHSSLCFDLFIIDLLINITEKQQCLQFLQYMGRWYAFLSASNHVHVGSHGILYEYEKEEGLVGWFSTSHT